MLNKALKQVRVFHQMTQADLANLLEISNSYLSEIESGRKSVSMGLLQKYSKIFSIPASSLLMFSEKLEADKASDKLRLKCAKKIIQIMEWTSIKDEIGKKT